MLYKKYLMWDLIVLWDRHKTNWENTKIKTTPWKTLDEYVNEMLSVQKDVKDIIESKWVISVSDAELLVILKNAIRRALVEKKALSEKLFPCGDYVWELAYDCILWKFDINQFTQDFLEWEEKDFRWAWDINLAKYMFRNFERRKDPNTAKDYISRAITMYYQAYNHWQLELWYALANNLIELDNGINIAHIVDNAFKTRHLTIQK